LAYTVLLFVDQGIEIICSFSPISTGSASKSDEHVLAVKGREQSAAAAALPLRRDQALQCRRIKAAEPAPTAEGETRRSC